MSSFRLAEPPLSRRGCACSSATASLACLQGEVFTSAEALALGMVHELAPAADVLDRAIVIAELTPADCLGNYAYTKRALQAPALCDIAELSDPQDNAELAAGMTSTGSRHAHRRYWEQLEGRPAE